MTLTKSQEEKSKKAEKAGRRFPSESGESTAKRPKNIGSNTSKNASMSLGFGSVPTSSRAMSTNTSRRRWTPTTNNR